MYDGVNLSANERVEGSYFMMKKMFMATVAGALLLASAAPVAAVTLETAYEAEAGRPGFMFDVVVKSQSLTITNMGVLLRSGASGDFELYTIAGGIGSNGNVSSVWTLHDTFTNVNANGLDSGTPFDITDLSLAANSTIGLYFTATANVVSPNGSVVRYTNSSTNVGIATDSNADLTILAGRGVEYPFDPRGTGRDFNGFLTYTIGGAVPEPSSWAMLIVGFGMVGVVARRRKTAVAA